MQTEPVGSCYNLMVCMKSLTCISFCWYNNYLSSFQVQYLLTGRQGLGKHSQWKVYVLNPISEVSYLTHSLIYLVPYRRWMGTQGEQCYPFKKKFRRISKMTILINAINIVMAIVVPLLEVAQLHKVKHEKRESYGLNQIR